MQGAEEAIIGCGQRTSAAIVAAFFILGFFFPAACSTSALDFFGIVPQPQRQLQSKVQPSFSTRVALFAGAVRQQYLTAAAGPSTTRCSERARTPLQSK